MVSLSGATGDQVHFGWLAVKEDSAFDLSVQAEPIGAEGWEEYSRLASFFARVRPTLIDYLVFEADFAALMRLPSDLVREYIVTHAIANSGSYTIRTHVIAEQRVNSFLSSASSFRDHLVHRLGIKRDTDHPINDRLRYNYDNSFAYRLCYNLRNFGQHEAAILHVIPVKASNLQTENASLKIGLSLSRERLLRDMRKLQPRVRQELTQMDGDLDLIEIATAYFATMRLLFVEYIALDLDDLQYARGYKLALWQAVEIPPDATPLLFEGLPHPGEAKSPGSEVELDCKTHHYSFDELAILDRILDDCSKGQLSEPIQ